MYAHYNDRTNLIQINSVIPEQPQAPLSIFKFMYTVKDNGAKEAIEFCKIIMNSVYKGTIYIFFLKKKNVKVAHVKKKKRFNFGKATENLGQSFWWPIKGKGYFPASSQAYFRSSKMHIRYSM